MNSSPSLGNPYQDVKIKVSFIHLGLDLPIKSVNAATDTGDDDVTDDRVDILITVGTAPDTGSVTDNLTPEEHLKSRRSDSMQCEKTVYNRKQNDSE